MAIISVEGLKKMTGSITTADMQAVRNLRRKSRKNVDTAAASVGNQRKAAKASKASANPLDHLPEGITTIVMDDSTAEAVMQTVATVDSILGLATGERRLGRGLDVATAEAAPVEAAPAKANGKPKGRKGRVTAAHTAITTPHAPVAAPATPQAETPFLGAQVTTANTVTGAGDALTILAGAIVAAKVDQYAVEEFDEVPDIAKPKAKRERKPGGGRGTVGPERAAFWGEMLERKRANPDKFIAIFMPEKIGRNGKLIQYSTSVGSANTRMSASGELSGYHYKCKADYKHPKTGVMGTLIWVEAGDYAPVKRASRKAGASPLTRLTKPARALYDTMCAVSAPSSFRDETSSLWASILDLAAINIMPPSHKAKAMARLKEVGLLRYTSDNTCEIKILS